MTSVNLRTIIIGIIGVILVGFMVKSVAYDFMSQNDITPDPDLNITYENLTSYSSDVYSWSKSYQNTTEESGKSLSEIGGESSVLKSVYTVIKMPFDLLKTVSSIMTHIAKVIGIDKPVADLIFAIVLVVIVSIILSIVTRSYLGW